MHRRCSQCQSDIVRLQSQCPEHLDRSFGRAETDCKDKRISSRSRSGYSRVMFSADMPFATRFENRLKHALVGTRHARLEPANRPSFGPHSTLIQPSFRAPPGPNGITVKAECPCIRAAQARTRPVNCGRVNGSVRESPRLLPPVRVSNIKSATGREDQVCGHASRARAALLRTSSLRSQD